jgi:hypothetical protein
MSFELRNMKVMVPGTSTVWNYWTDDTATKVKARGYFEAFKGKLAVGHWIFATTSTGGVILHADEIDPLELGAPK